MRAARFAAASLAWLLSASLCAAELHVFSAGAAKSAVSELLPRFERATGHKITATYMPMGELRERLARGERADFVVVSAEVAEALEKNGTTRSGAQSLARTGVGVAVHQNARAPDISSADAFKKTLLDAKSIVMIDPARGTSGAHLAEVFKRLDLTDALRGKTKLLSGGYVVEPVGRGEIELGLHQISEILPVPGVKLVGPLPEALQKWTVYTGAIPNAGQSNEAAQALLRYLTEDEARAVYKDKGFQ
jgi:molybdate transport system substrate-binding protein